MALSAVTSLLGKLSSPAMDEMNLLEGIGREVNELKDDLEFMKTVLQDYEATGETDEWLKTWVGQVRDVAYDVEDILDEYYLRMARPYCTGGICSSFSNCLECIEHFKIRHSLATHMQHIKTKIEVVSRRRINMIPEGIRGHTTPAEQQDPRNIAPEAEVVGIEVPKNKLIGWLTEKELKLSIITVIGMGGSGKTTLVRKVCDSEMVNKHFFCQVWIGVSQSPVIGDLLRKIIKDVRKVTKEPAPEGIDAMKDDDLCKELWNQLREKRYVIIFDDIWDIKVWKKMESAFLYHYSGSRIIFTTRLIDDFRLKDDFTKYAKYTHCLEPLGKPEAWELFCMKAFGPPNDSSSGCPEELNEVSHKILTKCSGLPLAIVIIGSLLAKKDKDDSEWENIHDSLGAEMGNNNDLDDLSKILLLSYNHLPYHLKPCFLYLSMFPKNYSIKRMMLIRLWIAEGLVKEKEGATMEFVAGGYLKELINRNMIQIDELNCCDKEKSCRIHDVMREIIQSKCKKERFSITINGSQDMNNVLFRQKPRRISISHNNTGDEKNNNYSSCSHIRSLMLFPLDDSPPRTFQDKFFAAFRFLRVLDLEGADLFEFPPELVELILLKYLSLRRTSITSLPKSVGKLINLETLDLKQTHVSKLPDEILNLKRLSHLLVYRTEPGLNALKGITYGVSVTTRIGSLTFLQKLAYLDLQHHQGGDANSGAVVTMELWKLTQLRRLGITNLRSKDGEDLCLALEKMERLSSLDLVTVGFRQAVSVGAIQFLELDSLKSPPKFLRHLYLQGRLSRLPAWIASLGNLVILGLRYSRLSREEDPLKAFQHMPNLAYLHLKQAYDGEELCCSEMRGYKNLKKLFLSEMEKLERVIFIEGSMPMLRELDIEICPRLKMMPQGIEHLKGLQELRLFRMPPILVNRIRRRRILLPPQEARPIQIIDTSLGTTALQQEAQGGGGGGGGGEDYWSIQHIPKIMNNVLDPLDPFSDNVVWENLQGGGADPTPTLPLSK